MNQPIPMNPLPPATGPSGGQAATESNERRRGLRTVLVWHFVAGIAYLLWMSALPHRDAYGRCGASGVCPLMTYDDAQLLGAMFIFPALLASTVIASLVSMAGAGRSRRSGARVGSLAAVCTMIGILTAGAALWLRLW